MNKKKYEHTRIQKQPPVEKAEPEEMDELTFTPLAPFPEHKDPLEERGIIVINKEISKDTLDKATRTLLELHFNEEFEDEVQLILNSPGGYTDAGWAFIDTMDFVRMRIRTIAMGEICSMATMIFVAGNHRVMSPNSTAMIHTLTTGHYGTYDELVAARKADDLEHQKIIDHFIRCSKYTTEKQVREHLLKVTDNWLSPKEMKEHGLCDTITRRRAK